MLAIFLLVISNAFMTLAWYGHLQLHRIPRFQYLPLYAIVFLSWLIALAEYAFQVPANRIGSVHYGGPFNLFELKILQEAISLIVFTFFAVYVFRTETLRWNHVVGFCFLLLSVYFVFKE
ncbi:MAG: DMT family protein [Leptospiraceae bacterium]|nr:DMT family protein [Leptospiraceae bacterium]